MQMRVADADRVRIMLIHPEGNIANNPNLWGIVEILCNNGYPVDIYSPKRPGIPQRAPHDLATLCTIPRQDHYVYPTYFFFLLPSTLFENPAQLQNFVAEELPHYALIIGVDLGIVEAAIVAAMQGVPHALISYELYFADAVPQWQKKMEIEASRNLLFAIAQDELRAADLSYENKIPPEQIFKIPVAGRGVKQIIKNSRIHDYFSLAQDQKILLYMGEITAEWSGIGALLHSLHTWPYDWSLLIHHRYGIYPSDVHEVVARFPQNRLLISPFGPMDFAELGELIQACDAGCAFYVPFYHKDYQTEGKNLEHIGLASGKIATYLQHGLPIVVNEIGEMSSHVRQFGLGWVVDNVTDTGRVLAGLHRLDLEQSSLNAQQFFAARLDLDKTITPLLSLVSGLSNSVRSDAATMVAAQNSVQRHLPVTMLVSSYFQPPAGSTESFVDLRPLAVTPPLYSAFQALKNCFISDFGAGFDAVRQIIRHIFDNKFHTPLVWAENIWLRTVVVQLSCDLVDRRTGKRFDELDVHETARFTQDFLTAEGVVRASYIRAYQEKIEQGVDLGKPLYVSGAVLNGVGASVDPHAMFMVDGARRISASALARRGSIEIQLIIFEEEYAANIVAYSRQEALFRKIDQLAWFNNYQSIPLIGIKGDRSLNRFALMEMAVLRDQTIMDFGCNLGQACIKAVMAGAQEVWGVEGMPDTYRIAEEIGRLSGFSNLRYLNVDFNDPDFDRQIDAIYPSQVDYTFFFSVYRTKELTQRDRLFRYIIQKTRKGIYFEGHADPKIDSLEYYDWLFESFGLTAQYLGNSEGELRPLFFIQCVSSQASPPPSPIRHQPQLTITPSDQGAFRVSAIVSTYAGERFMEGRLKDLLEQTLGNALEIIVVDSNSPEDERAIVERYMVTYPNIVYIRTEQRETVYQAWNRGVVAARGKYLTNANTDDRLRPDALELMADLLDAHTQIALVYADFFITNTENMEFYNHIRTGYSIKPDYTPAIMLHGCHMGPQPLWRKSLHEELGYFDSAMYAAGDYDFWCRIACKYPMLHLPEFLGLYLHNPSGICNSNTQRAVIEAEQVKSRYHELLPEPASGLPTGFYYKGAVKAGQYVNIGMITYNRLEFTCQAIDALVQHTDFPYVLTVVDNASSDGTVEYLQEQKRKGIIKNLILLDENIGVAKASNLAWSLESGAGYYLKLDNDIVIQKSGWLTEMVHVIDALPDVGAVAYNFEPVSYPEFKVRGIEVRPKNGNLGGACVLIPRRTHTLLGYWCEDYGLYGEEDADYGFRIMQAGLLNAYMYDENVGVHLPAGKAAVIDPLTLLSSSGGEEELYAEYRTWKDELRRKNVLSGHFVSNLEKYARTGGAVYIQSGFAKEWHERAENKIRGEKLNGLTVSIIIPVFNQAALTRKCLNALLAENRSDVEIIVIDNGSSDWTPEYLVSLGDTIRLVTNTTNLGFAKACNQGAAAAKGRYLIFLNNDTVPQHGWLDALLAPALSGAADIVGACLLYPDGTIQHAGVVFDEQGPLHCFKRMPSDAVEVVQPRYLQAVTGACMLLSAELFQQLGRFDEEYTNGFEDIDLCLTAVQQGYRVYYQPDCVLIHYEESSQGRKLHDEENYARFLRRWLGRWRIDYKPDQLLISVIIPVFNQLAYTRSCLDKVFATTQQLAGRIELIVVDNGSSDGTAEYLQTVKQHVQVVYHQQNLGFSKGCNSGAQVAKGSYLLFLNNDTEPCAGWLEALLAVFEQEQGVGIAGSKLLFPDGTIQHAGVTIVRDPYLPAELSPCHLGYRKPDGPEYNRMQECQAITAACMMIPNELFRQLGGFDEGYWNGFEDVDLCFKVHEAGYRIVYQPASVVIHHESMSGNERKEAELQNLKRLQDRWAGRIQPEYLRVSPDRVEPLGR